MLLRFETGLCSQAVCIPVIFHNKSVLVDSLPYRDVIPYNDMVVRVPIMDELSPLDLQLIYMVSNSYVYASIWKVVDVVNKHLQVEFPIDDRA